VSHPTSFHELDWIGGTDEENETAANLAGMGRLVSISKVGLPEPRAVWLGYLVPELLLPFVLAGAHYASS
jgi:hypothetical protein